MSNRQTQNLQEYTLKNHSNPPARCSISVGRAPPSPHGSKSPSQRASAENAGTSYNTASQGRRFCPFPPLPGITEMRCFRDSDCANDSSLSGSARKSHGVCRTFTQGQGDAGRAAWVLMGEQHSLLPQCWGEQPCCLACSMYWVHAGSMAVLYKNTYVRNKCLITLVPLYSMGLNSTKGFQK